MDADQRSVHIVARLREHDRVDVASLARELDTSEVTVRRDLDALAAAGVLRRVHGGAVSLLLRGEDLPFALREQTDAEAKARIARAAAALVTDGEAVIVDSGSTGLAVARALAGRRLTVVPMSLPAATLLVTDGATTVKLPGGTATPGEGALVGPLADATLRSLRVDTAFVTCCGLNATDGVMAYDDAEAVTKRTAMTSARRRVLVAEAAKLQRSALAVIGPVSDVHVMVTDAPRAAVAEIEDQGVEVLCV